MKPISPCKWDMLSQDATEFADECFRQLKNETTSLSTDEAHSLIIKITVQFTRKKCETTSFWIYTAHITERLLLKL